MKTQALSLALAAVALLSTAANAQSKYSYHVNGSNVLTNSAVIGGTTVLTQPAVLGGTATYSAGYVDAHTPLFGEQTHWDNDMEDRGGLLSGLFGSDERIGVNTYSAVVNPTLDRATRISGQQKANEFFSLRLFGFGLGFGKVDPDLDMRPSGHAM